jgi:glycine oxidase
VSAGGRVVAVVLESGERIDCEAVVLASGAWSGTIAGLPRSLPVAPVKGQMVALWTDLHLNRLLQSPDCYIIPRSGERILVGATVEHAGFDARTTAGGIETMLSAARRLVPALADAELSETWAGFRPGTPDDLPILGPEPRLPGLVYATGHFRNGILLAPITADLIAAISAGEEATFPLDAFLVERFGA